MCCWDWLIPAIGYPNPEYCCLYTGNTPHPWSLLGPPLLRFSLLVQQGLLEPVWMIFLRLAPMESQLPLNGTNANLIIGH